MMKYLKFFVILVGSTFALSNCASEVDPIGVEIPPGGLGTDYYVHPAAGDDTNNGTTPDQAIRTLQRASQLALKPGDRLLLAGGERHAGSLELINVKGKADSVITVTTFALTADKKGQQAHIDAKGEAQGVLIQDCKNIEINSLYITANGYEVENDDLDMRCGIFITTSPQGSTEDIVLSDMTIRDIFFENPGYVRDPEEVNTSNGTDPYGYGIRMVSDRATASIKGIRIEDCNIVNIEHTGIRLTGTVRNISDIVMTGNQIHRTGGPGVQMGNTVDAYIASNVISHSGSTDDTRKWGRGSGLWTWTASRILIEKNRFLYANGPADSAGAHIDFNCDNVIMQYNFSAYNAGGFCEILGNAYNCAYRYNISVNDGHRINGQDGASQDGKIIWLSGHRGPNFPRKPPVNTYIYNNTIYVNPEIVAKFAIENGTDGLLIANNIFHIVGESRTVMNNLNIKEGLDRLFFSNNLFLKADNWPSAFPIEDSNPVLGDADFVMKGGLNIEDYLPRNKTLVKGKGINIPRLGEDPDGLMQDIDSDIMGNPIGSMPGIGALEVN